MSTQEPPPKNQLSFGMREEANSGGEMWNQDELGGAWRSDGNDFLKREEVRGAWRRLEERREQTLCLTWAAIVF